uniref:Uncharacterized protein n=1 Tax=Ditylenchus dipsaci TaxID=166011 RepID=A0A915DVU5_9BILA
MSGAKRPVKFKTANRNLRPPTSNQPSFKDKSDENSASKYRPEIDGSSQASGLILSRHKQWPDLPQNQSKLFFECTLFLYSVLALFLQYLNLYKTLWWLPKSHWHYSMKFHLINPYLLSCIGLALGLRVTKCFWDDISERIAVLSKGQDGWQLTSWKVIEYALIKTPLVTTVLSSFLFSFTRIFGEFHFKAIFYFVYPFLVYIVLFHLSLALVSENKFRTHQEAALLLNDFDIRSKNCIFMGLFTAYFAVFMPRAFIPERTSGGDLQYMLVDDIWVTQLFFIVSLTGFSLYVTYLFQYSILICCIDVLYIWILERIQPTKSDEEIAVEYNPKRELSEQHGKIVLHNAQYFQAQAHPEWSGAKTVAAEPGNADHLRLFRIAKDPVLLVTYMCAFQGALVAAQFWMLILTTDWQHIVTLVLLMFANYLLLAKIFKDRVVIGRIYKPSIEDLQLVKQLQQETLST